MYDIRKSYARLSVSLKLTIAFVLIGLTVTLFLVLVIYNQSQTIAAFSSIVTQDNPRIQALLEIKSLINEVSEVTLSFRLGSEQSLDQSNMKSELLSII